jgi:hypothetical protein
MARHIERRKFLVTLGGAAAAWPLAARAQQPDQMRRIGVLMGSEQKRSGFAGPSRGVSAGASTTGVDRGPQYPDR